MRGAEEEEVEGVHGQEEDEIQEILLSPFFLPYTLIFIVISWRVCCGYLWPDGLPFIRYCCCSPRAPKTTTHQKPVHRRLLLQHLSMEQSSFENLFQLRGADEKFHKHQRQRRLYAASLWRRLGVRFIGMRYLVLVTIINNWPMMVLKRKEDGCPGLERFFKEQKKRDDLLAMDKLKAGP